MARLTQWININDGGYISSYRAIEGSDGSLPYRVAFIEKSGRVRVSPYTDDLHDSLNWKGVCKGCAEELGLHEKTREEVDRVLISMGYELPVNDCRHFVKNNGVRQAIDPVHRSNCNLFCSLHAGRTDCEGCGDYEREESRYFAEPRQLTQLQQSMSLIGAEEIPARCPCAIIPLGGSPCQLPQEFLSAISSIGSRISSAVNQISSAFDRYLSEPVKHQEIFQFVESDPTFLSRIAERMGLSIDEFRQKVIDGEIARRDLMPFMPPLDRSTLAIDQSRPYLAEVERARNSRLWLDRVDRFELQEGTESAIDRLAQLLGMTARELERSLTPPRWTRVKDLKQQLGCRSVGYRSKRSKRRNRHRKHKRGG